VVAAVLRTHSDVRRATTLVDLAKIEFEAGDYERALDRFEQSLVESPGDGEVWGLAAITTVRLAAAEPDADMVAAKLKARRCLERAEQAGASTEFVDSVRAHVDSALLRYLLDEVRRRGVVWVPGIDGLRMQAMNRRLREAIIAAKDFLMECRASDDVRFEAAMELRQLTVETARQLHDQRTIVREIDGLLAKLTPGDLVRTKQLSEQRARERVLPGVLVIGGVLGLAILLAVLMMMAVT
jgi:tetratricopeptide (TPR) repeat protein